MNIHEYQANELFNTYGVPVLHGVVASTKEEAKEAAKQLGGQEPWVVKAQVHAGGRGKAGGVKLAKSYEEVERYAGNMLHARLVTHQSGEAGAPIDKVFIVSGVNIEKEYYLALAIDAAGTGLMFVGSSEGGMEIEKVASEMPDAIARQSIDLNVGVKPYMCEYMSERLGLQGEMKRQLAVIMKGMFRLFTEKDCSMVEINPLAMVEGRLVALDSKINFEDNALMRHPDIEKLRDINQEDEKEVEAAKYDLNYVALDGTIGCMVNGAGLAMATMDMIHHFGGDPANFLDVGGSASKENIAGAFRLLLSDTHVRSILVNIFGGIMKCDVIAEGIVEAAHEVQLTIPLVVRLEGTNAEAGKKILADSKLPIILADTFEHGVKQAVEAAQI